MIDLLILKLIILGTLLIFTFLFGIIPLKFTSSFSETEDQSVEDRRKSRIWKKFISLLSCYAGGVFLATCLLDLLPQVREKLNHGLESLGVVTTFPVGEFAMTAGLFMILAAEQCAMTVRELRRKNGDFTTLQQRRGQATHPSHYENLDGPADPTQGVHDDGSSSGVGGRLNAWSRIGAHGEDDDEDVTLIGRSAHESAYSSLMRSIFLLLSLSVHSVFEGLAVGLQSEPRQVLQIFAALVIHKSIIAFSLGLNLVQNSVSTRGVLKAAALFAITSPLGIATGAIVMRFSVHGATSELIDGVLEGIACGTFVYVVFFEILPQEFRDLEGKVTAPRLLKLFATLCGHFTIVLLVYFSG